MPDPVVFIDLKAQQARLGSRIEDAIRRVLDHGKYIMGPEIATLESQLSAFCGARHAVTCANGTEALSMVLMAWGHRSRGCRLRAIVHVHWPRPRLPLWLAQPLSLSMSGPIPSILT